MLSVGGVEIEVELSSVSKYIAKKNKIATAANRCAHFISSNLIWEAVSFGKALIFFT